LSSATQTLRLPEGRDLAWCERGVPGGIPVFVFHGLPGSRLQRHPDESISTTLGARIILTDRPGFGLSAPQSGRTLADWPVDVARLADHLGIERFAIIGVSGGGPSVCACAAMLGDRITRAAVVSAVGPPGTMSGSILWLARLGFSVAPNASWALRMPIALSAGMVAQAPGQFIDLMATQMSRTDRQILARPEVRAIMLEDLRECFRQGSRGFTDDLHLTATDWPIDFSKTRCKVRLWHGSDDTLIPSVTLRALAGKFPAAEQTMLAGEGHYLIFDHWREILGWLVTS
jgi:pimeloyl-ACP methyl ester carboxylesterase